MKPWFVRWRRYPVSIILHILGWGAPAGALLATEQWPAGVIMLVGFGVYEIASGVRHLTEEGHMDTIGLDCVDAVIGAIPAYIITELVI